MPSPADRELETLIRARYPIIYIVSWEEKRVEDALRGITSARGKRMFTWSISQGMVVSPTALDPQTRSPQAALEFVLGSTDQAVFVLKDFHHFISDTEVARRLRDLTNSLKTSYKTLVILSPVLKLPPELEKEVTVVDYPLPSLEDLDRLLENIIQSVKHNAQIDTELEPAEREHLLKAAQGLTANEAENVFARSLVEKRGFDVNVILTEKEQIIRKSGTLEYYRATEGFADVGGLAVLKDWMRKRTTAFSEEAQAFGLPAPKGILLLGVQGCGKSLTAKAIASQWRLPLLRMDVGKVFSGIVGSSEDNMRRAIRTGESVAPCVAGDTRIVLADGSETTIQELFDGEREGLRVLAMHDDWRLGPVAVRAVTRRPAPDLYRVRLRHAELRATSNHLHPVLRDGALRWTRTDELRRGDHVAIAAQIPTPAHYPAMFDFLPSDARIHASGALSYARAEVQTPQRRWALRNRGADFVKVSELADPLRYPALATADRISRGRGGTATSVLSRLPEHVNDEIGYLLGLLASDGFLGCRGAVGFVNTDLTLHARFAQILREQFGVEPVRRLNDVRPEATLLQGTGEKSVFAPCYTSILPHSLLNRVLRRLEERLLAMPEGFLCAWLRGYFDGDGCITDARSADPKITLTAKRAPENERVRSVLRRLGFLPSNAGRFNIELTGHGAVRRFIARIGSEHPGRQKRMEAWLRQPVLRQQKDRGDVIPAGDLLRRARLAIELPSHRFHSTSSSLVNYYERNHGHPSRARLRFMLADMDAWAGERGLCSAELESLRRLVDSPIAWSPVQSVTPEPPPEFVYDLVCAGPHSFIANGVVTHNCILWIDELEKGFAGTQSSPFSDAGTTSRVFASFITWLQEKTAPVFVVATANRIEDLPPELMRKGRFDEIFFIDLPERKERREIFSIHLAKRKRDPASFDLDRFALESDGFSGAEIEQAIVSSLYDAFDAHRDIVTEDVLSNVRGSVPLSRTMQEQIDALRDWASTRARPASGVVLGHPPEAVPVETPAEQKADNPA